MAPPACAPSRHMERSRPPRWRRRGYLFLVPDGRGIPCAANLATAAVPGGQTSGDEPARDSTGDIPGAVPVCLRYAFWLVGRTARRLPDQPVVAGAVWRAGAVAGLRRGGRRVLRRDRPGQHRRRVAVLDTASFRR